MSDLCKEKLQLWEGNRRFHIVNVRCRKKSRTQTTSEYRYFPVFLCDRKKGHKGDCHAHEPTNYYCLSDGSMGRGETCTYRWNNKIKIIDKSK